MCFSRRRRGYHSTYTFSVAELPFTHSYRAHNLLDCDGLHCKLGLTLRALLCDEGVDLRPGILGQVDVSVRDADRFDLLRDRLAARAQLGM